MQFLHPELTSARHPCRLSYDPNAAATVKLLLAYGADANATNSQDKTAFKASDKSLDS